MNTPTIAKNYLREDEIKELNRIVNMWLDFAEDQALRLSLSQIFIHKKQNNYSISSEGYALQHPKALLQCSIVKQFCSSA
jgi:hypothetical protein